MMGRATAKSGFLNKRTVLTHSLLILSLLAMLMSVVWAPWMNSQAGASITAIRNPVNGHFYEAVYVPDGITWDDAKAFAELRTVPYARGHLATINTRGETDFILSNFPQVFGSPGYWLGGYQAPESTGAGEGWRWVTRETFYYQNWSQGEPNDSNGNEDVLQFALDGYWNDAARTDKDVKGFVVEYDTPIRIGPTIVINPGEGPIDFRNDETIPVAILSVSGLDATKDIDRASLTFGRTGHDALPSICTDTDVNGDGFLDLLCHFSTRETGFQEGDTVGVLRGQTTYLIPILSRGPISFVPGSLGDTTPPIVSASVNGALGENDWHISNVEISWSVSDPDSDITSAVGCETITVAADTEYITFSCEATSEGGTASESVTIRRDATPPEVGVIVPANGNEYLIGQEVLANWTAFDSTAGIGMTTAPANTGEPIATDTSGSIGFTVTAIDKAGNRAVVANTYYVLTPKEAIQSLVASIQGFNTLQANESSLLDDGAGPTATNQDGLSKGAEKSLTAKLDAASASLDRGQEKAAVNLLNSFINQVTALTDGQISTEDGAEFIERTLLIIDSISPD